MNGAAALWWITFTIFVVALFKAATDCRRDTLEARERGEIDTGQGEDVE